LRTNTDNEDGDNIGPSDRILSNPPTSTAPDTHVQVLVNQILNQRLRLLNEQPDARYYALTTDLLADEHFAQVDDAGTTLLRPPLVADLDRFLLEDTFNPGAVDPGENRAGAIEEAVYRFRRMQNLITTKADVYEILVVAQTGYGVDTNGDGRVNWRDDDEFTVTGEKTARTIYER
jgi:hypothetical protein